MGRPPWMRCAPHSLITVVLATAFAVNQAVIWPSVEPNAEPLTEVPCPADTFDLKRDLGLMSRGLYGSIPENNFHELLRYAQDTLRYRRNIYTQLNESYISRLRNSRIEIDLHFRWMLEKQEKYLKRFGAKRTKASRYLSSRRRDFVSSGKGEKRNTTKTSPGATDFEPATKGRPASQDVSANTSQDALPPCVRIRRGWEVIELIKKTVVLLMLALPVTEDELYEAAMEEDLEYYFLRMEGRHLIHPPLERTIPCPPCYMRGREGTCRQLFFCRNGKNISRVIKEVTMTSRPYPLNNGGK